MNVVVMIVVGIGSFLAGRLSVQKPPQTDIEELITHVEELVQQNETLKEYIYAREELSQCSE